mmetsp:Transcript_14312/g.33969  ORF Transcript_14312/g.33969 Transcript_14312/m.33969 type:complete len:299 (-) Transcript_14312:442-1338(-)
MDQEVRGTLLHHLRRNLALTLRKLLNIVGGQGDHVRDARHRGGHGQGQAQHCTGRQRQGTPHEEVQVVARGLLQVVGRPVHNHAGQVLVQVAQHRETNGWEDRVGDAPGREVLLDAHWVHNPAPLALAISQSQGRGQVCLHRQHVQVGLVGVDGGQCRGRNQGHRHGEVGQKVSEGSQRPRGASAVGQLGGQAESVDEEQCLKHGVGKGHLVLVEVGEDWPGAIDDEDQTDEASEDVFTEHGHVLHQSTKVEDGDEDGEEGAPDAHPEVVGHELQIHALRHVIANEGVGQERPRRAED